MRQRRRQANLGIGHRLGFHTEGGRHSVAGAIEAAVGQARRLGTGDGDEGFLGLCRQPAEDFELSRVELVEAVHYQEAPTGTQVGSVFQGDGRQPPLPFGVGPFGLVEPALVPQVDGGQLFQAKTTIFNGVQEVLGLGAGALEFLDHGA
ncbi:MAG: hypothetical protein MAG451_01820 [Anaerolineales bacterium]|nr:hypothetical protein [Anaerolineales bacterium]